jgi:hypothetical protein
MEEIQQNQHPRFVDRRSRYGAELHLLVLALAMDPFVAQVGNDI